MTSDTLSKWVVHKPMFYGYVWSCDVCSGSVWVCSSTGSIGQVEMGIHVADRQSILADVIFSPIHRFAFIHKMLIQNPTRVQFLTDASSLQYSCHAPTSTASNIAFWLNTFQRSTFSNHFHHYCITFRN